MRALTEQGRPLYDRLREMVIHPLSPADVGALLDLPPLEALEAQLVIGGIPVLAQEWGRGRALNDYLGEALTDPTSFLVVSAERALNAEFRSPAPRAVLAAIGAGARAHSAILSRTGLSATAVNETLGDLRDRGVVRRLTPYSTKPARKTALWEIVDPYLRFWSRRARAACRRAPMPTATSRRRSCPSSTSLPPRTPSSESARTGCCANSMARRNAAAGGARSAAASRASCAVASTRPTRSRSTPTARSLRSRPASGRRQAPSTIVHEAGELDKLETIRAELGAPEARFYFFDRVAFSPRLRELEAEREDVHLVLADQLA